MTERKPSARSDDSTLLSGFPVGSVAGITVRVHPSVLIVIVLFCTVLAVGILPDIAEGHSDAAYWVTALAATVALFVSVLLHEFGHALVARRRGHEVRSISLWLFGGIAELDDTIQQGDDQLAIAAAGPVVSLALGVAIGCVAVVLDTLGVTALVSGAVVWLAVANIILAVFNLLPAFPLDGGRIYAARLRRRGLDELAAIRRATRLGSMVALALGALGIIQLLAGGVVGGVWLMAIAWFLYGAAEAELARSEGAMVLGDLTCADVMTRDPISVPESMSVASFISDVLLRDRHMGYPVVDDTGRAVGLVTLHEVQAASAEQRQGTVGEIARSLSGVPVFAPDHPARDVVALLRTRREWRALIVADGRVVGVMAPTDLLSTLATTRPSQEEPGDDSTERPPQVAQQ